MRPCESSNQLTILTSFLQLYKLNSTKLKFQRPRPQSKAGHDEQGGKTEEEECQSESQTKGAKSHKDTDKEKIDGLFNIYKQTNKQHVNTKKRKFTVKVEPKAPRVVKTLIKQICCEIACMQNMYKPQSQTQGLIRQKFIENII